VVARHYELIFCLSISPKSDLGKVKEAMFEVLALHFVLIFCILASSKCDLDEVDEALI